MYAFILSYNRPLYLWACLDSFYRNTRSDVNFVIIDNHSPDPAVKDVIAGFDRMGMFEQVIHSNKNDPHVMKKVIENYKGRIGELFVYIESDTVLLPPDRYWVSAMESCFAGNPKLAMLGSRIDQSDFIAKDWLSRHHSPISSKLKSLTKWDSPERLDNYWLNRQVNPAGRFVMWRSMIFQKNVIDIARDSKMHQSLIRAGYETAVSAEVLHRHLSLQNYYHYPDYDVEKRDKFMSSV